VDIKRARFRADSTPQDDKLVSCLRKNCRGIRNALLSNATSPSATNDTASASRKRTRSTRLRQDNEVDYVEASEDDEAEETDQEQKQADVNSVAAFNKQPQGVRGRGRGRPRKIKSAAIIQGESDDDAQKSEVDEHVAGATRRTRSHSRVRQDPPVKIASIKPVSTASTSTSRSPAKKEKKPTAKVAAEESEVDTADEKRPLKATPRKKRKTKSS
jgi:hypothetical protein